MHPWRNLAGVWQNLRVTGFAEKFLPYYTHTAVCKFFFFLDPLHMQKIRSVRHVHVARSALLIQHVPHQHRTHPVRIRDLACSLEFAELSELRQTALEDGPAEPNAPPSYGG